MCRDSILRLQDLYIYIFVDISRFMKEVVVGLEFRDIKVFFPNISSLGGGFGVSKHGDLLPRILDFWIEIKVGWVQQKEGT